MDTFLFVISGLAMLAVSIVGFIITTRPPKTKRGKRVYEASFIVLALLGTVATLNHVAPWRGCSHQGGLSTPGRTPNEFPKAKIFWDRR